MRVLYIEPFDAGSHAAFGRTLTGAEWAEWTALTLPGRHWKWRMRGSAVYFAEQLRQRAGAPFDALFASAYLPLAELVGLRPELASIPRVLYFHENQLAFPVSTEPGSKADPRRDLHFGFTQLVSALAATRCVFNSAHNRDSFLDAARELLRRMPDAVPPGWVDAIAARSEVLGLPLALPQIDAAGLRDLPAGARADGPLIVWNHRWEHDKGPDSLVRIVDALLEREQLRFRLAVCGQSFRRKPPALVEAEPRLRQALGERLVQWGHLESRADYLALLGQAQVALSTARHEFFGVAMLEAAHAGAQVLVPDRLSYPELFPPEARYADEADAIARLAGWIRAWRAGARALRGDHRRWSAPHHADAVLPRYRELLRPAGPPRF
ncbi:glycosyl transferase, group 1 [Plesiocystis pacifica SIR-1]|uniref:tRNA-queuosine alpha-mannosyltransferase n=1 Tax=Plesiocystis pacifica SIR-1 TaxID=391625 RepID=A6G2P4_9BACT|nr:DUF3524 domain-containing protein [Plesiocystis pacifica]EDM79744.1 glycosyl transferase, group 1 [Plesiocystis pacifica SIR-1]